MASKQSEAKRSEANKRHYETIAAYTQSGEQRPPEEAAAWNDAEWTKLTAEPGRVDFLEVEVGGRPALWIVPKGAAHDRVIFYVHGGGFVGGSIYTHRKMIALSPRRPAAEHWPSATTMFTRGDIIPRSAIRPLTPIVGCSIRKSSLGISPVREIRPASPSFSARCWWPAIGGCRFRLRS